MGALTLLAIALVASSSLGHGCMALSTRDDTILDENGNTLVLMGANWFGFNNAATMVRGASESAAPSSTRMDTITSTDGSDGRVGQ